MIPPSEQSTLVFHPGSHLNSPLKSLNNPERIFYMASFHVITRTPHIQKSGKSLTLP
jgi:hypothetical protein